MNHRTIAACLLELLKQKKQFKLSDAKIIYEVKTRRKISRQAIRNVAKRLEKQGKCKINFYGTRGLYLTSLGVVNRPYDSMVSLKLTTPTPKKLTTPILKRHIHSAHKIKIPIPYVGVQPTQGALVIKAFGRYRTAKQAIYKIGELTIQTYRKTLMVWVHRPPGIRTEEQLINAKVIAYLKTKKWADKFNIKLGYLGTILQSHHVLENKYINEFLKPLFEKYGEEIYEHIGSKICPSSHKGKIEHTGKKREKRVIRGSTVASGVEYLFVDLKKEIQEMKEKDAKYHDSIELYDEQIRKHLKAIELISKVSKESSETMKQIRDLIKEFIKLKKPQKH